MMAQSTNSPREARSLSKEGPRSRTPPATGGPRVRHELSGCEGRTSRLVRRAFFPERGFEGCRETRRRRPERAEVLPEQDAVAVDEVGRRHADGEKARIHPLIGITPDR